MIDQELFDKWQDALNRKQHINNNRGAYTYYEQVATKHATRVCGFRGEPYYTYHTETRFNHQQFQQDHNAVDQDINQIVASVNSRIAQYQQQLVKSLQAKEQLPALKIELDQLRTKSAQLQTHNTEIQQRLSRITTDITGLNLQNQSLKQQIIKEQAELDRQKSLVAYHNAKISLHTQELDTKITDESRLIEQQDQKSRAVMLAKIYTSNYPQADINRVINIMETLGFDTNYLAYLATTKNSSILLNYALESGAQCTTYALETETGVFSTVLQLTIQHKQTALTNNILSKQEELGITLYNAVINQDTDTLFALLTYKPSLAHNYQYGYTILHIAISCAKFAAVKQIIAIDSTTLNDKNNYGDSSFKMAVRSSSNEIAQYLVSKVDIAQELASFIIDHDSVLFNKALTFCQSTFTGSTGTDLKQFLLTTSLQHNEVLIARSLINTGASIESVLEHIDESNAAYSQIIHNIIEIDASYTELAGNIVDSIVI